MEKKVKEIIESILFSTGREVKVKELALVLERAPEEIINFIEELKNE